MGNPGWMRADQEAANAFVSALQRGYQLGADDPAQGAKLMSDANPGVFTEPELVSRSQEMLAPRHLKDATGKVGTQNAAVWSGFSDFLYDAGVLAGGDGKPLTVRPDFATWFTTPGA